MTLKPSGRWADTIKDLLGDGPAPNRTCEMCFASYYAKRFDSRFCSPLCKQKNWLLNHPLPPLPALDCLTCGQTIPSMTKQIGPRRKTCSDECRRIHGLKQQKKYTRR